MDISYLAVAPALVLLAAAVLVLMVDVFAAPPARVHGWIVGVATVVAALLVWVQWNDVSENGARAVFDGFLQLDKAGIVASGLMLVVLGMGSVAAWSMFEALRRRLAEGVSLVLLSAAGFMLMGASSDLVMIFVGLEIGSISLYILAGIAREKLMADEAAVKYFLLGSFASAIFIYGAALAFASTGSTSLAGIGGFLANTVIIRPAVVLVAVSLLLVGLAFKVTAAPFHQWAPDVYQGSPAGAAGFMAAAAKVGGFAALVRILVVGFDSFSASWGPAVAALAVVSMTVGTLLAIQQSDLRRMLAYSGVAHAGFILTGVTAGATGLGAVWFYLATYIVQLIAAFAIVAVLGGPVSSALRLDDLAGLGRRSPFIAAVLAIMMLAMSGLPLTAGFVAKFSVFTQAWGAGYGGVVIVGLVASVAGFYFYLRTLVLMYFEGGVLAEAPGTARSGGEASRAVRVMLLLATAVTLVFGFFPGPLLDLVADALPF